MLRARRKLEEDVMLYVFGDGSKEKSNNTPASRRQDGLGVAIITLLSVVTIVGPRSPSWLVKGVLLTGLALLGYKLLAFRRWKDEHRHVPLFLICFCAMLLELSFENGMVWLVSASDMRKYDNVPPLQDNVLIVLETLERARVPLVSSALRVRWLDIRHFLGALLALAFSVLWEQVPYSGFGIMSRVVLTICCSRCLRVACFMCTVLPAAWSGCYASRFPPVPDNWWDTLLAGYTTIRGFGGCNDLIFSGHGAFWVLAPLAVQTYYPGHLLPTALLWLGFVHASLGDVLSRQHYSVDMLLACVVTAAVWGWLRSVYPESHQSQVAHRPASAPRDPLSVFVLGLIVVALGVAAVIVIGGKA